MTETTGKIEGASKNSCKLKIEYSYTQSAVNNTSTITEDLWVYVNFWSRNETSNSAYYSINGGSKVYRPYYYASAGWYKLGRKTITVTHNSDGNKTVTLSGKWHSGLSTGNTPSDLTVSGSVVLKQIKRLSTLVVSNGTLGTSQDLTVTMQNSSYTHTITYKCGDETGTICTKSANEKVSFTPPLSLAKQNTSGVTVSVTYTIETFTGSTSLGKSSKTVTCSIPSTVVPSIVMTVTDSTGLAKTYGNPIKGLSSLTVDLAVTQAYNSPIKTYKVSANGEEYTSVPCTTNDLKEAGQQIVTATVTDNRNRSASESETINVLDYSVPVVTKLSVKRCNSDGTENDQGEYIQVTFSGTITPLNNKNSATWQIQRKKSTDDRYITSTVPNKNYSITDYSFRFSADSGSSYDVRVVAKDDFATTIRTTSASTGFTIMHFKANGRGMAAGKISELDDVFDIGFQTRFYGGILFMVLTEISNIDEVKTPNFYVSVNNSAETYINLPPGITGTFILEVLSAGAEGQICQRLTSCHKTDMEIWQRFYYEDEWGEWVCICRSIRNYNFTVSDSFTIERASLSMQNNIVNLYVNALSTVEIAKGVTIRIGQVPIDVMPPQAVSNVGIVGDTGSCAAWIRVNDEHEVMVRPFETAAKGTRFELMLTWNLAAVWQSKE